MAKTSRVKKTRKPSKIESVEVIKPKGQYLLTISALGSNFTANADNAQELRDAILSAKPKKITNQIIISLEKNGKKVEKRLFVIQARRLFNFRLNAEFMVKNLTSMLG
jgi:elongation factor P hydroxylase